MAIVQWLLGHEAVLSALAVAVLDLVFSVNESAKSNGILHWAYLQLQALAASIAPKA